MGQPHPGSWEGMGEPEETEDGGKEVLKVIVPVDGRNAAVRCHQSDRPQDLHWSFLRQFVFSSLLYSTFLFYYYGAKKTQNFAACFPMIESVAA